MLDIFVTNGGFSGAKPGSFNTGCTVEATLLPYIKKERVFGSEQLSKHLTQMFESNYPLVSASAKFYSVYPPEYRQNCRGSKFSAYRNQRDQHTERSVATVVSEQELA